MVHRAAAGHQVAEIATPVAEGRALGGQRAGHAGLSAGRPQRGPGYAPGGVGPTGSGSLHPLDALAATALQMETEYDDKLRALCGSLPGESKPKPSAQEIIKRENT